MRLPNAERAIIPPEKLRDYLLNPDHPDNGGKARLFAALGYPRANWPLLREPLREQHLTQEAIEGRINPGGPAFEIVAWLRGPLGEARIKSVWQIDFGSEVPRFLTAYPP